VHRRRLQDGRAEAMAAKPSWSDWVAEPPFELRFALPWMNYDGDGGPGQRIHQCGLKAIDFALADHKTRTLYLLEVKSAEWFQVAAEDKWEQKVCDLFRCFMDSLGVLARLAEAPNDWVRDAARAYRVRLVVFYAPRTPDVSLPQGLSEILRKRLRKKFRSLDIDSDVLVETLATLQIPGRADALPFEVR